MIAKTLPSSGRWCVSCNAKRLDGRKGLQIGKRKSPLLKKRTKASGEGIMLLAIWNTRQHVSGVSGERLGDEMNAMFFSHILPKSVYPKFRLLDRNIVLMTPDEHHQWDHEPHSNIIGNPMWEKIFNLQEQLKREYYGSK